MDYKLFLDLAVAALLVATIVAAFILNRRIDQLRSNRDELAKMILAFTDATQRAEAGVPKLRRTAEEAGQALQERVEKAQSLRDDLAFLVERADTLANRLEDTVRAARSNERPGAGAGAVRTAMRAAPPPSPSVAQTPSPSSVMAAEIDIDERSEAERELLRALQAVR